MSTLRHSSFRLLLAGELISNFGDGIFLIALPWYVLAHHGGALLLGSVMTAYGAPRTALLIVGGHASDRYRPWTVMLWANCVRGVAVAALAATAASASNHGLVLIVVAVVLGSAEGMFILASEVIVPALLPRGELQAGNALISGTTQLSQLAGPAIGGLLVALVGRQLAAGIAHEINTPLQFVGDSVTFLREAVAELLSLTTLYRETLHSPSPTPVQERRAMMREAEEEADVEYLCERIPKAFERTSDGIERVRSIVLAMKRFSHASSDEMAPADINEALETTLAVCRNEYKYVATVVTELGELPLVQCNISELNQVFLNLIINAAQAIEEQVSGSGRQGQIRISTRTEADEVVIEIADDGPGIPSDVQDRIYEPFFTTKEVGRGTGQGLAIARAAVEHHSGSLECRSQVGVGTVFSIRLPAGSGAGCASGA